MRKKYTLVRSDRYHPTKLGPPIYRIKAARDIPGVVRKGELGGYVESTDALSQVGRCWLHGSSKVYGGARVSGDAQVFQSTVRDGAVVADNALLCHAVVSGGIRIGANTHITRSYVAGKCALAKEGIVSCSCDTIDCGDLPAGTILTDISLPITVTHMGSANRPVTFSRLSLPFNDIGVLTGCFNGTISEFRDRVTRTHSYSSRDFKSYMWAAQLAEARLGKLPRLCGGTPTFSFIIPGATKDGQAYFGMRTFYSWVHVLTFFTGLNCFIERCRETTVEDAHAILNLLGIELKLVSFADTAALYQIKGGNYLVSIEALDSTRLDLWCCKTREFCKKINDPDATLEMTQITSEDINTVPWSVTLRTLFKNC